MITPISRKDVPRFSNKPKSARRVFADETLADFFASTKVGDVVEVTDMPRMCDDPKRNAQTIRQDISYAAYAMDEHTDMRKHLKVFCRGERLFIERIEPWVPPRQRTT